MRTRRWLVSAMAIALLLTFCACGDSTAAVKTTAAASSAITPSQTTPASPAETSGQVKPAPADVRISFAIQEYEGENIVEIPCYEYDGGENQVVDSINRLFNQGLQMYYEDFLVNADADEWIEIRSYPFTDEQYVQVVVTSCVYPDAEGSALVESVNYDKVNNRWIQFSDLGITEEFILFEVGRLYEPELNGAVIDSVEVAGFLLRPQGGEKGDFTEIVLEITTKRGGDFSSFYYLFCPDTGEFYPFYIEAFIPFDHADMDNMDPPLYYDQFEPQTGG